MPPLLILIAPSIFQIFDIMDFFACVNSCDIVVYSNSFVKSVTKHKKIESYFFGGGQWNIPGDRLCNVAES